IPDHGAGAVINLPFLTRGGFNPHSGFGRDGDLQLAYEALDTLITGAETLVIDQVLPDRHGIAALQESRLDGFAVGSGNATRRMVKRLLFEDLYRCQFRAKVGITSLAGFAGSSFPHPPGGRTGMPMARR